MEEHCYVRVMLNYIVQVGQMLIKQNQSKGLFDNQSQVLFINRLTTSEIAPYFISLEISNRTHYQLVMRNARIDESSWQQ